MLWSYEIALKPWGEGVLWLGRPFCFKFFFGFTILLREKLQIFGKKFPKGISKKNKGCFTLPVIQKRSGINMLQAGNFVLKKKPWLYLIVFYLHFMREEFRRALANQKNKTEINGL